MAKKADTPTITVKVNTTLYEDSVLYNPGDDLTTTAERAEALGDAVTLPA